MGEKSKLSCAGQPVHDEECTQEARGERREARGERQEGAMPASASRICRRVSLPPHLRRPGILPFRYRFFQRAKGTGGKRAERLTHCLPISPITPSPKNLPTLTFPQCPPNLSSNLPGIQTCATLRSRSNRYSSSVLVRCMHVLHSINRHFK